MIESVVEGIVIGFALAFIVCGYLGGICYVVNKYRSLRDELLSRPDADSPQEKENLKKGAIYDDEKNLEPR
jgi:hypothetical protein